MPCNVNAGALQCTQVGAVSEGMSTSLIHPNGAIAPRPICEVKVQHVARPPTPWGWVIHVEGQSTHVYTSNGRYRSAQEAWEAGQKALAILQQGRRPALPAISPPAV